MLQLLSPVSPVPACFVLFRSVSNCPLPKLDVSKLETVTSAEKMPSCAFNVKIQLEFQHSAAAANLISSSISSRSSCCYFPLAAAS